LSKKKFGTKADPSQVGDVVATPGPWTTSGQLTPGWRQQYAPCQLFLEQSGHKTEPT